MSITPGRLRWLSAVVFWLGVGYACASSPVQESTDDPPAASQEQKPDADPSAQDDPLDAEFEAIRAEYNSAMQDWQDRVRAANVQSREQAEPFIKERAELNEKAVAKYLEFAAKNPKHPRAFECYLFAAQSSSNPEQKKRALDQLLSEFVDDPRVSEVLVAIGYDMPSVDNLASLRQIHEKSKAVEVRGTALYFLGKMQFDAKSSAEMYLGDEQIRSQLDAATLEFFEAARKFPEQEALDILKKVHSEFADVDLMGQKLGELSERLIFEIEHLSVGKTAPEIEGEDIDGQEFKLSDYRGKVVLLDFWGDW